MAAGPTKGWPLEPQYLLLLGGLLLSGLHSIPKLATRQKGEGKGPGPQQSW